MPWAKNNNVPFPSPHQLGVFRGRRVILISLMEPPTILILAFIELVVIGALVFVTHLFVTKWSGLDNAENIQKYWIKMDKEIREPHRFAFVLWLIYGIGFNCLIRSFLYSVLQIIGVIKLYKPSGFVEEYIITCICSFGGSFLATAFYKSESNSLAVLYSVALAIIILPTGLLKLIVANKQTSAGDWVLWSVSIVALSLISSLAVYKFVIFPANMLKGYQLEGYETIHFPSSADNAEENEEGRSSEEPTLQHLTEQGYTVKDVLQKYGKNHDSSEPDVCLGIVYSVTVFTVICVGALASSGGIEFSVYSYYSYGFRYYLSILVLNIAQLVELVSCGFVCLVIQILAVPSPKNYGWSVLITNILFFIGCYVKDMIVNSGLNYGDSKSNTEFLCAEVFRVPFKLATVEFLWVAAYLFICLKRAKSILGSVEPHELDSFDEEQTQTV